MLEKKVKFKKAVEAGEPLKVVTALFYEYKEAYKRLRHPSRQHDQDYEKMYNKYVDYLDGLKEKVK
jgi:hypothetical protein